MELSLASVKIKSFGNLGWQQNKWKLEHNKKILMQEMKILSWANFSIGKFSKYILIIFIFNMGNSMRLVNETGTLCVSGLIFFYAFIFVLVLGIFWDIPMLRY